MAVSIDGLDRFRLAKELVFRGAAIALLVIGVFEITRSFDRERLREARREIGLAVAVVVWCLISTLVSTNRMLSFESMLTVMSGATIFVAARLSANRTTTLLDVIFLGALVNSVVVILQEYGVWNPFKFDEASLGHPHLKSTAFVGNPNDVGAYLAAPALMALVAAATARGKRRWIYLSVAVVLAAGLVASATRTALVAFAAAAGAYLFRRSRRLLIAFLAVAIATAVIVGPRTTVGKSMMAAWQAAKEHRYDVVFSERVSPFLCATEMARAHPVTGAGPGAFKFGYMDCRSGLLDKYPGNIVQGAPVNFGEVHNDHLQVLAETGVIGYLLFLAAIALLIGRASFQPLAEDSLTGVIGRDSRLPIALLFVVLAIGQFPLQLAAPRFVFLVIAALTMRWSTTA